MAGHVSVYSLAQPDAGPSREGPGLGQSIENEDAVSYGTVAIESTIYDRIVDLLKQNNGYGFSPYRSTQS